MVDGVPQRSAHPVAGLRKIRSFGDSYDEKRMATRRDFTQDAERFYTRRDTENSASCLKIRTLLSGGHIRRHSGSPSSSPPRIRTWEAISCCLAHFLPSGSLSRWPSHCVNMTKAFLERHRGTVRIRCSTEDGRGAFVDVTIHRRNANEIDVGTPCPGGSRIR